MAKAATTKRLPPWRPREYDREQIAQDMLAWAAKGDSINLNHFCATNKPCIAPTKISDWAREDDYFREAYELTKAFIAFRREMWLNAETLHVKSYDLNAAVYDHFIREERKAQASFEASLKALEQTLTTADDKARFDALMNQLSSLQSERKINDKSIKASERS